MRQNRKVKIIAIVALCVSVVGLTLGFAAFSNTLTISSSATISPNPSDFKIKTYGTLTELIYSHEMNDINSYTSDRKSVATSSGARPLSMSDAVISEDGLTISDISVTFKKIGEGAYYCFAIKNEGKYDAYLDLTEHFEIEQGEKYIGITCTAKSGTSQELVDKTCENMHSWIELIDADGNYIETAVNKNNYTVIPTGGHIFLSVGIEYGNQNNYLADGDFDVAIEDIKFNFSTVAPEK